MNNILFELGTEELPPKALNTLAGSLYDSVCSQLDKANINFDKKTSRFFASPRRLAFILNDIDLAQADKKMQRKGPAVMAAFDENGNPKPAAIGFAKSVGMQVSDLGRLITDKGEWLICDIEEKGNKTSDLLPEIIQTSIKKLPIPKPMRWGDHSYHFIRPVHWMILLQNKDIIKFDMFGLSASNQSRGHRFHNPDFISIDSADTYLQQLLDVNIEVDQIARKFKVKKQVKALAESINAQAIIDDDLLEEVTAIVELPVALVGEFDIDFLQVPQEALISSMQKHQKYFPIVDEDGHLTNNFIALANIKSKDPKQVIKGFEKVIRPRLADARFFWEKDQKTPLEDRFSMLEKMTFEKQLGSIGDKCQRIKKIMFYLGRTLGLEVIHTDRVSTLLKCDLVTDMVDEFPDLQGIMGGYYAEVQGEDVEVYQAIKDQYRPVFSGDKIPSSKLGQAISIADKMDTLCGIFAVGKKPTGNKDPFALRRSALGVIRILQEAKLPVNFYDLIKTCLDQISLQNLDFEKTQKDIEYFFEQRLKHNYLEQNIPFDVVDAVLKLKPENLDDCSKKILACNTFKANSNAKILAFANKRIVNLLRKAEINIPNTVNIRLLKQEHEKNLYGAIESMKRSFNKEVDSQQYAQAFNHLISLAQPIDNFFENIMVNSDDMAIKTNRLALLKQLNTLFNNIADISLLEI